MSEYFPISATVVAVTDLAVLLDTGENEGWVPRSLIRDGDADFTVGETDDFDIKTWFCKKEGLI